MRIKARLALLNATAALYPEVKVVCDLRRRTELDRSKLSAAALAEAQRTVYSETLTVKEAKRDDS